MPAAAEEKLLALLDAIDPDRTLDKMERRAGRALGSYAIDAASFQDWRAYAGCLAHFFGHLERHLLNLPGAYPGDASICWGQCIRVLDRMYGANGEKVGFQLVRSGAEGGLYGVLQGIARTQAQSYAEGEIQARVSTFWHGLSVAEQSEAIEEYIRRFGGLLPAEARLGNFSAVRVAFWKVLAEHPQLLRRLRHASR